MSNTKEDAVRRAAEGLHKAIVAAREEGFHIDMPRTVDGLLAIEISATGKGSAILQVDSRNVPPEVARRAAEAGQKAVDKVMADARANGEIEVTETNADVVAREAKAASTPLTKEDVAVKTNAGENKTASGK